MLRPIVPAEALRILTAGRRLRKSGYEVLKTRTDHPFVWRNAGASPHV